KQAGAPARSKCSFTTGKLRFSPVFALRWLPRLGFSTVCYTPERPGSSAVSALGRQAVMVRD
ncbi:hypothetical protein, partial [Pseudomonas sp. BIOMIG1BDMA]|uniref:hypothetical protein n=1 Tax=Pseudomonas sp. BIOMIG1BDMA TaxID=1758177 RepID=UPI0019D3B8D6